MIAVLPILLGVVPFGMIVGVTAARHSVSPWAAVSSSWTMFAGAAQLVMLQLLDRGTPWIVVLGTALVINTRFFMYSASIAPYLDGIGRGWKTLLPYILTDQGYVVSIVRWSDPKRRGDASGAGGEVGIRLAFFFGASITLWSVWQVSTWAGFLLGAGIPASWSLEFAVPLTFLALLATAVRTRPAAFAAVVGGTVALALTSAPFNLGLLAGAVAGVTAGAVAETRARSKGEAGRREGEAG